jgi:hypothetical protein
MLIGCCKSSNLQINPTIRALVNYSQQTYRYQKSNGTYQKNRMTIVSVL